MVDERSGVVVRSATLEDAAAVVALLLGGLLVPGDEDGGDLAPYAAALAEVAADPWCAVLIGEHEGSVIAMTQVITFRHVQHRGGRCAEIESMHVAAPWRSRGVGGVLLERAVSVAGELGCYRVQLTSNKVRGDAHRFYERHGFEATHEGFKRRLDR